MALLVAQRGVNEERGTISANVTLDHGYDIVSCTKRLLGKTQLCAEFLQERVLNRCTQKQTTNVNNRGSDTK
jgi:hypothetical protein